MAHRAVAELSKGNSTWFPLASEKTLHELYAGDAPPSAVVD